MTVLMSPFRSMARHPIKLWTLHAVLLMWAACPIEAAATPTLTLLQLLKVAEKHAHSVTLAQATIAQAKAQKVGAIADFLPSLSISDQNQYYHPSHAGSSTVVAGSLVPAEKGQYNNSASVDFNLNLYHGGKDHANLASSRENLRSAKTGLSAAFNDTFHKVLSSFEAVASDEASLSAQEKIVELNRDIQRLTKDRMSGQAASRIDLINAQQQTLSAETQVSQSRQQLLEDQQQLARTIGYVLPVLNWRVEKNLPPAPHVNAGEYSAQADPAVQSSYAKVLADRQQVDVAKAAFRPQIALSAQYNLLGTNPSSPNGSFGATRANNYSVGLSISMPLLPLYNTISAIDSARAKVDSDLSAYQDTMATVMTRNQNAYEQFQEAKQGEDLARQSSSLAQQNVQLTSARLKAKQSSRIELDQADILSTKATLSSVTAMLRLRLAQWQLYQAAHPIRFSHELMESAGQNIQQHKMTHRSAKILHDPASMLIEQRGKLNHHKSIHRSSNRFMQISSSG